MCARRAWSGQWNDSPCVPTFLPLSVSPDVRGEASPRQDRWEAEPFRLTAVAVGLRRPTVAGTGVLQQANDLTGAFTVDVGSVAWELRPTRVGDRKCECVRARAMSANVKNGRIADGGCPTDPSTRK